MTSPRTTVRVALVAPTLRIMGGHAVQAQRLLDAWQGDPEVLLRLVPIDPAMPRPLAWSRRVRYLRTIVSQICYWRRLLQTLRNADVVHVFSPSNRSFFLSALPAVLAGRLHRTSIIVNYHGDGSQHLEQSAIARHVLRTAEAAVVPSSYFHGIFATLGLEAAIVPNIADRSRFRFRPRSPLRPRLLSTRNFEPIYNVACTLRAFARVQARHPDASLVLVGAGSGDRALRRLAADLQLRSVTFAGCVPHAEIHRCYDAADIYVQTPVMDNMPGSVFEAFASGLPVVSTRVGGVPAILEHGVQGLLAASDDDEGVAGAVCEILDRPDAARRMAAAACESCLRYDATAVREQWRRIYREVSARSRLPAPVLRELRR